MKSSLAALSLVAALSCSTKRDVQAEGASQTEDDEAPADSGADRGDDEVPEGNGSWTTGAALLSPLQENAVVALAGEVWVVGGYDATGSFGTRVEAYDPAADTWRTVTEVPQALHHANAAVVDGALYVLGLLAESFQESGVVWRYDPAAEVWEARSPMPAGRERGASAIAVVDGRIYVAGGLRNWGAVDDFSVYDPETDAWTALAPMGMARDHLTAAAISGRVYVAGGRGGRIDDPTDRLEAYDPETDSWTTLATMPTPRGGIAGAALDGRLYVFGGEGNPETATGVFDDVEVYDPTSDTWAVLDPMPTPRHGTGAAGVDDTIWVPGGADVEAFGAVATNEGWVP